jgi:hypothetical protein
MTKLQLCWAPEYSDFHTLDVHTMRLCTAEHKVLSAPVICDYKLLTKYTLKKKRDTCDQKSHHLKL